MVERYKSQSHISILDCLTRVYIYWKLTKTCLEITSIFWDFKRTWLSSECSLSCLCVHVVQFTMTYVLSCTKVCSTPLGQSFLVKFSYILMKELNLLVFQCWGSETNNRPTNDILRCWMKESLRFPLAFILHHLCLSILWLSQSARQNFSLQFFYLTNVWTHQKENDYLHSFPWVFINYIHIPVKSLKSVNTPGYTLLQTIVCSTCPTDFISGCWMLFKPIKPPKHYYYPAKIIHTSSSPFPLRIMVYKHLHHTGHWGNSPSMLTDTGVCASICLLPIIFSKPSKWKREISPLCLHQWHMFLIRYQYIKKFLKFRVLEADNAKIEKGTEEKKDGERETEKIIKDKMYLSPKKEEIWENNYVMLIKDSVLQWNLYARSLPSLFHWQRVTISPHLPARIM